MQSTAYRVSTVCVPCVRYASAGYGKRQSECHRSQMNTLHCMLMPLLSVQQHCRTWEAMPATLEASGRLHGTRSSRVQDKLLLLGCLRRPDSGPVFNSRARAKFHPMSVEQLRFKDPTDFGDAITKFGSYARVFLLVNDPNSALRSYFFPNWGHFCPRSPQKKDHFGPSLVLPRCGVSEVHAIGRQARRVLRCPGTTHGARAHCSKRT